MKEVSVEGSKRSIFCHGKGQENIKCGGKRNVAAGRRGSSQKNKVRERYINKRRLKRRIAKRM